MENDMKVTRRGLLKAAAAGTTAGWVVIRSRAASVRAARVKEVTFAYEDYLYRTPIKFGGTLLDRVTLLNVHAIVEGRDGKSARGLGSMPLGNVWAFPTKTMTYETTLGAMKALAERIGKITSGYRQAGHPVEINWNLEPEYLKAAQDVSSTLKLAESIPKLCALVTASPFDAALHDAYGKLHGLSSYKTYGPEFLSQDLSRYLGSDFRGEYLDKYVVSTPKPRMPLYHLVGAVDPIFEADIQKRIGDGLPETLPEWIRYNGLTHIKIKLNGENLDWDVQRVLAVDRAAAETQKVRGVRELFYSCDFNEKCANVQYLLDFLNRIKEKSPEGFARIQYIEQPTARDLKAHRANVMHEASKLRPVVIDESLTDLESLLLAREMGYTGAALKACKGQSQALLMAAAAQKYQLFLCVQDLTCPGASLVHSAGLAAHIPGVAAIEANSRQYVPAANREWEKRLPGIFVVRDGMMQTGTLTGPGLSAIA
jgi:L-alanine-DL-glutamate epimerase-like enolase superfamily enzyme